MGLPGTQPPQARSPAHGQAAGEGESSSRPTDGGWGWGEVPRAPKGKAAGQGHGKTGKRSPVPQDETRTCLGLSPFHSRQTGSNSNNLMPRCTSLAWPGLTSQHPTFLEAAHPHSHPKKLSGALQAGPLWETSQPLGAARLLSDRKPGLECVAAASSRGPSGRGKSALVQPPPVTPGDRRVCKTLAQRLYLCGKDLGANGTGKPWSRNNTRAPAIGDIRMAWRQSADVCHSAGLKQDTGLPSGG